MPQPHTDGRTTLSWSAQHTCSRWSEAREKKENSNDHKAQMKIENEFGVRVIWFRRMVNAIWNSKILNSTNLSFLYSLFDASRMWVARTSGSVSNLLHCFSRCSWVFWTPNATTNKNYSISVSVGGCSWLCHTSHSCFVAHYLFSLLFFTLCYYLCRC